MILTVTDRHVQVFGNAIYHDNKYARYCYRGHFKIQRIIILIIQNFECILRKYFSRQLVTMHIYITFSYSADASIQSDLQMMTIEAIKTNKRAIFYAHFIYNLFL